MSSEVQNEAREIIDLVSSDDEAQDEAQDEMVKTTSPNKRKHNKPTQANKIPKTIDTQFDVSLVNITVRSPTQDIRLGALPRNTTIGEVKEKIFKETQLAVKLQHILWAGKMLKDKTMLSDYTSKECKMTMIQLFPKSI